MTATFDVIIPFWADTPGRAELFKWTSAQWVERFPEAKIYSSDGGPPFQPFNRARARNHAAALGSSSLLVLWDADVPPPSEELLYIAVRQAQRLGWSPVFSRTVTFSPSGTRRLLDSSEAGFAYAVGPGDMLSLLPMCMGPTIVKRRLFEMIGGQDTRYVGWGFEDTSMRAVLTALYGQPPPPPQDAVCWSLTLDPLTDKRAEGTPNRDLYLREYKHLDRSRALELIERRRRLSAS